MMNANHILKSLLSKISKYDIQSRIISLMSNKTSQRYAVVWRIDTNPEILFACKLEDAGREWSNISIKENVIIKVISEGDYIVHIYSNETLSGYVFATADITSRLFECLECLEQIFKAEDSFRTLIIKWNGEIAFGLNNPKSLRNELYVYPSVPLCNQLLGWLRSNYDLQEH